MVLRLTPWRARVMARVLEEWSAVSRVFSRPTRTHVDELALSRILELAASVLGGGGDPILRFQRGDRTVPSRRRLAAAAVLAGQESGCRRCSAWPWWMRS